MNKQEQELRKKSPIQIRNKKASFEYNFGTEKMAQQLKELGIKLDVYVSPGTHHEWLTWRRCFKEFVPHLFKW